MAQSMNRTPNAAARSGEGGFAPVLEAAWSAAPAATAVPASRKRRVNWSESLFNAIWMVLMLSCVVACVSRLLWAVQP